MGISSGIAGLVGGLAGLFGGGSNQPTPPPGFTMPGMGQAANSALSGIGGLGGFTNLGNSSIGTGQNIFNTLQGNPFGNLFQGGALTASGLGQSNAINQFGLGTGLASMGASTLPLLGNITNTAFDPQSALYARTQQQVTDQSRANAAAAGLATTPYGVGLTNQATQNFNIDWQNQQLGRQLAGIQGAGNVLGSAGGAIGAGTGLAGNAAGQFLQSSGLPYSVFNQLGNDQYANLSTLLGIGGQGQGLANTQIQDYLNYVQAGNQANNVANQLYGLQLQSQNQQFNQNMQFGRGIGGGLFGIGSGFGGGGFGSSPLWGSIFGGGGGGYGGYGSALSSMGASINPLTGFISMA
jgi:hypothetical protein